jgi:hypothetical protein
MTNPRFITHLAHKVQQLLAQLHVPPPHRVQLLADDGLLPRGQLPRQLAERLKPGLVLLHRRILRRLPATTALQK